MDARPVASKVPPPPPPLLRKGWTAVGGRIDEETRRTRDKRIWSQKKRTGIVHTGTHRQATGWSTSPGPLSEMVFLVFPEIVRGSGTSSQHIHLFTQSYIMLWVYGALCDLCTARIRPQTLIVRPVTVHLFSPFLPLPPPCFHNCCETSRFVV